jgi:hypothetical protein
MNNEKHYYKEVFLFLEDVLQLTEAIILAQNYYGNQRTGVLDRDTFVETRIEQLERVLDKIHSTRYKELPEPPQEK